MLMHLVRAVALLGLLLVRPLPTAAEPVAVAAAGVPLNPEDRLQAEAGRLTYVAGFVLSSRAPDWGGFSGMVLAPGGRRLTAVSDTGHWLDLELTHDQGGRLTGIGPAGMAPLAGLDGAPVPDKRQGDAEALVREPDGALLVAFERNHRLWRYRPDPDGRLAAHAEAVPAPAGLTDLPANGGIEAMTALADGRQLLISEQGRSGGGDILAWIGRDRDWREITLAATGHFKPTDAATMPDGAVLLLERRYTAIGGPAARLSIIDPAALDAAGAAETRELARLLLPQTVDNFEAVAVLPAPAGGNHIYLLSDDNFSPLQRTLLLQFHLPEGW